MSKDIKKVHVFFIILLCLLISGCGNGFAKTDYDADEKIAKTEDRYGKEVSVFNAIDGGYSFTISKFDGRETLWSDTVDKAQDIELDFSFTLSKGKAKVVHIDEEGNVTTIIECVPETSTDGFVTKTVSLKSGWNRLKIVGYDCKNIDLQILFTDM